MMLSIISSVYAQEICDNGIDDDNDGLIDMNDNDCECQGPVAFTLITGSICRSNLVLQLNDPEAIAYQWFKDGIAIPDENEFELILRESPGVEGIYNVVVFKDGDCFISEDYALTIPTYNVYLGEVAICDGDSYQFGNFSISTSGFFQNNSPAVDGCDSITSLDIVIEFPTIDHISETICEGTEYDFYGEIITSSGVYEKFIPTVDGCDSTVVLNLNTVNEVRATKEVTICEGENYEFGTISTQNPGTYETLIPNPNGCDSLFTITLDVLNKSFATLEAEICEGETFFYESLATEDEGLHELVYTNHVGCDSILQINLTILKSDIEYRDESICQGDTFEFEDISETTSGEYRTTLVNSFGCDSTIVINLAVGTEVIIDETIDICQGDNYDSYGITADTQGFYENRIPGSLGCDTIISIQLNVHQPSFSNTDAVICEGDIYDFHGIFASESDVYEVVLADQFGCDSTVTLNLEVESTQIGEAKETFCEGDLFVFMDLETYEEGVYEVNLTSEAGCDSIVRLELEMLPLNRETRYMTICEGDLFEYEDIISYEDGIFETYISNENGCDSLITIELNVLSPGDGFEIPDTIEVKLGEYLDIFPVLNDASLNAFIWYDQDLNVISESRDLEQYYTLNNTSVTLFAIDKGGCEFQETVYIRVDKDIDVYIPNVFTPTSKTDNNRFTIGYAPTVESIERVIIMDRWGELIYEASGIFNFQKYKGWDGTFKNEKVPDGVYTYMIDFKIIDGSTLKKTGTITIL